MININPPFYVHVVAALNCIQGLYLISLKWICPDIAYRTDILFGLATISYGLRFWIFNFRMEITTQLVVIFQSVVVFWYIYQSISLRRKLND